MTLITITLIFVSLIPQSANAELERCYQNLAADCYYVSKEKYVGLEEFEFFWVEGIKGRHPTSISGKAYIDKRFIDLTGTSDNYRFAFVVHVPQGFTYRFVGRFLPGSKSDKDHKISIEGRLGKFKGSRRIRSIKAKFSIGHGSAVDKWHPGTSARSLACS
jgi:hypothetical protein